MWRMPNRHSEPIAVRGRAARATPIAAALCAAFAFAARPAIGSGAEHAPALSVRGGGGAAAALERSTGSIASRASTPAPREPAVDPVFNCADSGPGSLRDAVASAVSGDAIDMTGLGCSTITLTTGAINVTAASLTLLGPDTHDLTITANASMSSPFRVITHGVNGVLTLSHLIVENGFADARGGCLYSIGDVQLDHATVRYCTAFDTTATAAAGGGIWSAGRVELSHSRVVGNVAEANPPAFGGGVYSLAGLTMEESSISANTAASANDFAYGGGVFTRGDVQITGSTIDHNVAGKYALSDPGNVGGLSIAGASLYAEIVNSTISDNAATNIIGGVYTNTPLTLLNSTIAFNTSGNTSSFGYYFAGGLHVYETSAALTSSILAGNTASGNVFDLSGYGALVGGTHNLIVGSLLSPPGTLTADPQLGPLQDNGGPTLTHALSVGSPAIDQGSNEASLATDQRGAPFARVYGAAADIGAFEFQPDLDTIFDDGFDGPPFR